MPSQAQARQFNSCIHGVWAWCGMWCVSRSPADGVDRRSPRSHTQPSTYLPPPPLSSLLSAFRCRLRAPPLLLPAAAPPPPLPLPPLPPPGFRNAGLRNAHTGAAAAAAVVVGQGISPEGEKEQRCRLPVCLSVCSYLACPPAAARCLPWLTWSPPLLPRAIETSKPRGPSNRAAPLSSVCSNRGGKACERGPECA